MQNFTTRGVSDFLIRINVINTELEKIYVDSIAIHIKECFNTSRKVLLVEYHLKYYLLSIKKTSCLNENVKVKQRCNFDLVSNVCK